MVVGLALRITVGAAGGVGGGGGGGGGAATFFLQPPASANNNKTMINITLFQLFFLIIPSSSMDLIVIEHAS
jgi:hypothetical protein